MLYIRLNLGVLLFHLQAPETQIVKQKVMDENIVSSVHLLHVLRVLGGVVTMLQDTLSDGQVHGDETERCP